VRRRKLYTEGSEAIPFQMLEEENVGLIAPLDRFLDEVNEEDHTLRSHLAQQVRTAIDFKLTTENEEEVAATVEKQKTSPGE
jgi:hypothetical protein